MQLLWPLQSVRWWRCKSFLSIRFYLWPLPHLHRASSVTAVYCDILLLLCFTCRFKLFPWVVGVSVFFLHLKLVDCNVNCAEALFCIAGPFVLSVVTVTVMCKELRKACMQPRLIWTISCMHRFPPQPEFEVCLCTCPLPSYHRLSTLHWSSECEDIRLFLPDKGPFWV